MSSWRPSHGSRIVVSLLLTHIRQAKENTRIQIYIGNTIYETTTPLFLFPRKMNFYSLNVCSTVRFMKMIGQEERRWMRNASTKEKQTAAHMLSNTGL